MLHLSARISWHDDGWNGCVCQAPHLNSSCIVLESIRDSRDDRLEREHAGTAVSELGWLPPCSRDISAYSPRPVTLHHGDPLNRAFLSGVEEDVPPFSVLPAPYRWLREENLRDISEAEGLTIRGADNPEKEHGWVYEPDRQRALLDHFWSRLRDEQGEGLVFFYVNHGNPVDETIMRLVVGVGRIADIGPQLYFDGQDEQGEQYPIWTRAVTQNYPEEGFRLPYQEYIRLGHDPRSIACQVPWSALLPFSYVGEHVRDDTAVGILERLIQSVRMVQADGYVSGPWERHLSWLDDRLADAWTNRGAYPGIGSVLRYLGCAQGAAFQRFELADAVRRGENPWQRVRSILNGDEEPPQQYQSDFMQARRRWSSLSQRHELLEILARFELTPEQVRRICNPDERKQSGIAASEEDLVANPYLIYEYDQGLQDSEPVNLDTIDRGVRPEGDAALVLPQGAVPAQDDTRRVRALAIAVLRDATDDGHTLLAFNDLLDRIRNYFPDRRACHPDRDIFLAEADYHRQHLFLDLDDEPQIVALQSLRDDEELIAETVRRRVRRTNQVPDPPPDWLGALYRRFDPGPSPGDRQQVALSDQARALETLFTQRVSVLEGSAGTGKTSLVRVFLDELERLEGKRAVYLLAPTGKARVRLSTETGRTANTIHQLLLRTEWLDPGTFRLKREGGNREGAPTIIIDECSMVPTDLLATLFKALALDMVSRLILVGDGNQLPPIGPGRPFVDLSAWLGDEYPQCVAMLRTPMRHSGEMEADGSQSVALALAEGYRRTDVNPGDDEVLSRVARGESWGDLEVHFWDSHDELRAILNGRMEALLGISDDYQDFNRSLAISDKPARQRNWRGAERWQILSPLRIQPFGTDQLNRDIQMRYRQGLIRQAQRPYHRGPRPFGDQEIVWTDKVMQIANRRLTAWPRDAGGLNYVANGEIGIVTTTWNNNRGDYLQVGFSSQDGVTYRYYAGMVNDNLELAYAVTVHKAQGSDFETVFLIIPSSAQTLSPELLYTGLTRFRQRLVLLVERDTEVLERYRDPGLSATGSRNTNLFTLSLHPDSSEIPFRDTLIHRTKRGVPVRSKSEVIVADILDSIGIETWEYETR